MADWKQIPDTDVDPDAPVTSELMYALRDNPVAIAEGAVWAPRVNLSPAFLSTTASAQGSVIGLDGIASMTSDAWVTSNPGSGQTHGLRVSFSSDNGSTWGAWAQSGSGKGWTTSGYSRSVSLVVDLEGCFLSIGQRGSIPPLTLQAPSMQGVNAFRIGVYQYGTNNNVGWVEGVFVVSRGYY